MKILVILSSLLLLSPIVLAADAPALKPNIVYILADDLGYGDVGFNGCKDIKTPHLDQLAREGAVLESFYAQPVCSPTRACLLTGRYPTHTGIYTLVQVNDEKLGLPLEERTLANALHDAGYETAISGKWHLGYRQNENYRPTKRGFDHQYGCWDGGVGYFNHVWRGLDWHRNDAPSHKEEGYTTHLMTAEACRRIREKAADKPLFLYVPYNAVHVELAVPDEYAKPYADLPRDRKIYAGMTAALDEGVGKIVATLKEEGLLDNTLIIFSSDNGGHKPGQIGSNTPLRGGKGTLYEGGIRVCALARWAGHIPPQQVIKEPLHAVDWYPTLVRLAGGSLEQKLPLDGRDIWPVLTKGAKSPHESLFIHDWFPNRAALRMGDWKLSAVKTETKVKGYELYNLAEDPKEKKNLLAENLQKVQELEEKMAEYWKDAVPYSGRQSHVRVNVK